MKRSRRPAARPPRRNDAPANGKEIIKTPGGSALYIIIVAHCFFVSQQKRNTPREKETGKNPPRCYSFLSLAALYLIINSNTSRLFSLSLSRCSVRASRLASMRKEKRGTSAGRMEQQVASLPSEPSNTTDKSSAALSLRAVLRPYSARVAALALSLSFHSIASLSLTGRASE